MRTVCACVACLWLLAACDGGKAPPVQEASKSLAAAREDIDKARTAIQATEQESKALQEKIRVQRAELNGLVDKRLALLRQQLVEDEERLRRLPAPRETELRPRLAELQQSLEDVKGKLQAYRDAPPDKASDALAALEKSLAEFTERRRELDAQMTRA